MKTKNHEEKFDSITSWSQILTIGILFMDLDFGEVKFMNRNDEP